MRELSLRQIRLCYQQRSTVSEKRANEPGLGLWGLESGKSVGNYCCKERFFVPVCQEGEEVNFKPCLIEDEGGPLEAAMQVEASNHRKLLW